MKNELVVKDNALINASYNLEVTEQRLILLAILNARETGNGITADSKLEIHAANKLSEMPEMSKYSQGTESYQQFAIRIADMLLEPQKFRELYPLLEKSGFQL